MQFQVFPFFFLFIANSADNELKYICLNATDNSLQLRLFNEKSIIVFLIGATIRVAFFCAHARKAEYKKQTEESEERILLNTEKKRKKHSTGHHQRSK